MSFRQKDAYSEPHQKPKMDPFLKIVHGFRLLPIFVKSSILEVELASKYTSADSNPLLVFLKNKQLTYSLIKLLLTPS